MFQCTASTDIDVIGNNMVRDDDNDGVLAVKGAYPLAPNKTKHLFSKCMSQFNVWREELRSYLAIMSAYFS
ncbi:hypothetical protein [Thalassotalea sp. PLHSN55]|uniref:hypothetical protein n=1 Tax=Thalassotalea sp. PLHSN55 TaxID=3435888 RepID=UPI003F87A4B6